jgi:hypothetical protein
MEDIEQSDPVRIEVVYTVQEKKCSNSVVSYKSQAAAKAYTYTHVNDERCSLFYASASATLTTIKPRGSLHGAS